MARDSVNRTSNEIFDETSFLYGGNAAYLEGIEDQFANDPASVDAQWREFFESLNEDPASLRQRRNLPEWRTRRPCLPRDEITAALANDPTLFEKRISDKIKDKAGAVSVAISEADVVHATRDSVSALRMVRAYRTRGHLCANLDPLGLEKPGDAGELDPASFGFGEAERDRKIFIDGALGAEFSTMREMLVLLKKIYCRTIGYEFMHISDPVQRAWI